MEFEVCLPEVNESLEAQASLLFWHKDEGDEVEEGEDLVEVETAKAVFILPAPVSGVLSKVLVKAGEQVRGGQKIGVINTG